MPDIYDDQPFQTTRFVVIDFEALTPAGRPHVPIEVAAITLGYQAGRLVELDRFASLIQPPADVPVTRFDTAQTGLTRATLAGARPAAAVMADLDAQLTRPPYRLVAHHAATEANLIAGQRTHCPRLAATSLLDTMAMGRLAYPELASHRLDALLWRLKISQPPDRHRALADTEVTAAAFHHMLVDGTATGCWSRLHDLDRHAGRPPATPRPTATANHDTLF